MIKRSERIGHKAAHLAKTFSEPEVLREERELAKEIVKLETERKILSLRISSVYSKYEKLDIDALRKVISQLPEDSGLTNALITLLATKERQAELALLRRQKQLEYRFPHEFRELYTLSDIPDNEWFGLDRHGNPASNAKNIALALKRLSLFEITFAQGSYQIKYDNRPIVQKNAPIFFGHIIRNTFKFIPKREQFAKAFNMLRTC